MKCVVKFEFVLIRSRIATATDFFDDNENIKIETHFFMKTRKKISVKMIQ